MKEQILAVASIVLLCIVLTKIIAHDVRDLLAQFFPAEDKWLKWLHRILVVALALVVAGATFHFPNPELNSP